MRHHTLLRCIRVAVAAALTLSGPTVLRAEIKGPSPGDKLYQAAESGSVPEIEELLKNGTAVDARNSQGRTALMAAVKARHWEATKLLIDRGADVNSQNETS